MATPAKPTAKPSAADAATKPAKKPRKVVSAKEALEAAKKQVAMLEQKAFSEQLSTVLLKPFSAYIEHYQAESKTNNVPVDLKNVDLRYMFGIAKRIEGVSELAIIRAIGNIVGIKRLTVTQADPIPRKPQGPRKKKDTPAA